MIIQITESRDYSEKALAIYKSLGPVYLSASPRKDANVLVLRLAYKIDSSWMDKMPNLKVIATPTTGLNHIDLKEAKKKKNWNRDAWRGHQFIHKTLGLLGCGRLGKIVAKYGKALGMRILGTDPNIDAGTLTRQSIEKVLMEKLFRESDIVSVHVSLEPDTHNLVQEKHLKMMKSTAYLINTARGEIIDEKALLKALENKWIAGAALDVMRDEVGGKHLKNNPLVKYAKTHDNLLIVPHLGGATYEAMHVTEDFIADLIKKYVR